MMYAFWQRRQLVADLTRAVIMQILSAHEERGDD
jgi:hypothetical protein